VRLGWDQQQFYKQKLGGMLGTGHQMLLDPAGNVIADANVPGGYATRYNLHLTPKILDAVSAKFPPDTNAPRLKLDWFLWPAKPPFNATAMANWDRKPMALVEGSIPAILDHPDFLRWHIRQFIWTRGQTSGPARLVFQRVMNSQQTELAAIDTAALTPRQLGQRLDEVWRNYMKQRPFTARGYSENPHGRMFDSIKAKMLDEELTIRQQAMDGTLLPPGRRPGDPPPYPTAAGAR